MVGTERCRASAVALVACWLWVGAACETPAPAAGPTVASAPAGAPPEVAQAQSLLQAGNADSAIAILEDYFRRDSTAVTGRLLLGNAYRQAGDLERALAAYAAVTTPRPTRLQARFSTAAIHAAQGRADDALAILGELKATGAFDMDLARTDSSFRTLQSDVRFAAVMFAPEDFRDPFVEPVRIIQTWAGEAKGDQFSWIARGAGDVDGDGVSDVVTSAPTFGAQGRPAGPGKVYMYSSRSGGLIWSRAGTGQESLGTGLEGAGDVDGDGVMDVIAGAPAAGRAYVLSGRDGEVLRELSGTADEAFGQAAAGAGDQNGDGHADVIVGAPSSSAAGAGAGRVYVFSGSDGAVLLTLDGERAGDAFGSIVAGSRTAGSDLLVVGAPGAGPSNAGRIYVHAGLTTQPKFVIESDSTGVALGAMFTSVVGDVDGDDMADVYAADFANAANGPSTGRIYVHSGATGRRIHRMTGENAGDGFGIGSADVGDVDGDGHDDLVVGAWQYAGAAPSGGRVYLYSGGDGRLLRTITCRVAGETFGFDATGIGDVDGDGKVDLLLTSTWSNVNGFRSGRMFIIAGT